MVCSWRVSSVAGQGRHSQLANGYEVVFHGLKVIPEVALADVVALVKGSHLPLLGGGTHISTLPSLFCHPPLLDLLGVVDPAAVVKGHHLPEGGRVGLEALRVGRPHQEVVVLVVS